MKLGVKLPTEQLSESPGDVTSFSREAEELGYDSLWVSDHIVMPRSIESDYPFDPSRRATWSTETPWFDVMVLLSMAAAVTHTIRLGTAVLVAPLRQPVVFAKQVASLDRLAGGRTVLGIGVGWMAEEFDVVGVPFAARGRMTDEWMHVVRDCWTGAPRASAGEFYPLAEGLVFEPTPAAAVPLIVGGTSPAALRRAAKLADGWMGHEALHTLDLGGVESAVTGLRAARAGDDSFQVLLRLVGASAQPERVAELMPRFAEIGIDELIIDSDSRGGSAAADQYSLLRSVSSDS